MSKRIAAILAALSVLSFIAAGWATVPFDSQHDVVTAFIVQGFVLAVAAVAVGMCSA